MGDGLTDDGDLVIRIDSEKAGGDSGQLILSDASIGIERSNELRTGIGNKTPQAARYGNQAGTVSAEGDVNEAMARLLESLYVNDESPTDVFFRGDVLEVRGGKMDWNNLETSASDDGGYTAAIDADLRDFDLEQR